MSPTAAILIVSEFVTFWDEGVALGAVNGAEFWASVERPHANAAQRPRTAALINTLLRINEIRIIELFCRDALARGNFERLMNKLILFEMMDRIRTGRG